MTREPTVPSMETSPLSVIGSDNPRRGLRQCRRALGRQGCLSLSAVRRNARHTNAALDAVTQDDRLAATRCRDVEVLELDIITNSVGVGRAGQLSNGTAILAAAVS